MILDNQILGWMEAIAFISTAVWAVSRIKATTDLLAESMEHLTRSLEKLDARVEEIRSELGGASVRLARLEERVPTNGVKRMSKVK